MSSKVISFKKAAKARLQQKAKGKTLCKNGMHKWQIDQEKQFDVKTGKLVTRYVCARCGDTKTKLH